MQMTADKAIRVLLVEDVAFEAELVIRQLHRSGLHFEWVRVETEDAMRSALAEFLPDIILSDFNLPQFDGSSALQVSREVAPEAPFIFVSGTIGEERAIDALRAGAYDYVLKDNLLRLAAGRQAGTRRCRTAPGALATGGADCTSGSRPGHVERRERAGGARPGPQGAAAGDLSARRRSGRVFECRRLCEGPGCTNPAPWWPAAAPTCCETRCPDPADLQEDVVGQIVRTGKVFLCIDAANPSIPAPLRDAMMRGQLSAVVGLPLVVDRRPWAPCCSRPVNPTR